MFEFMGGFCSANVASWARDAPDDVFNLYRFAEGNFSINVGEFDRQAKLFAWYLRNVAKCTPGDRVVLCFSPDYYHQMDIAIFGTWYAGCVIVPVAPADPTKSTENMKNIVVDCDPTLLVTDKFYKEITNYVSLGAEFKWTIFDDVIATSESSGDNFDVFPVETAPHSIVLLQYTSGSTSRPKGVCVTASNIVHNCLAILLSENQRPFEIVNDFDTAEQVVEIGRNNPEKHGYLWLPLYHDMGLMSSIVYCFLRKPTSKSNPLHFLSQPSSWLEGLSEARGSTCPAPSFAFSYALRKCKEIPNLDLSHYHTCIVGAEPVNVDVMQQFVRRYSKYGFSASAVTPAYGLAEGTLLVTGAKERSAPPVVLTLSKLALHSNIAKIVNPDNHKRDDQIDFISCGAAPFFIKVKIVDPDTRQELNDLSIGEIWVHSPCVARGYWRLPHLSMETFYSNIENGVESELYLRTGDLGFIYQGELFCTGRIKDMIIIRGRNIYPHDIENLIQNGCKDMIRPGCVAAFSLSPQDDPDKYKQEELCVAAEIYPQNESWSNNVWFFGNKYPEAYVKKIVDQIRKSGGTNFSPSVVILVSARTLPKTTSGKIQRKLIKSLYLEKKLPNILHVDLQNLNKLGGPRSVFDLRDFDSSSKEDAFVFARPGQSSAVDSSSYEVDAKLATMTHNSVAEKISESIAAHLEIDPSTINRDKNIAEYNVDSIIAVSAAQSLEKELGFKVNPIIFNLYPSVNQLSTYIVQQAQERSKKKVQEDNQRGITSFTRLPSSSYKVTDTRAPQKAYILGIGTTNPENPVPADATIQLLTDGLELTGKKADWVKKVVDSTTIAQRYSVKVADDLLWGNTISQGKNASFDERNTIYKQHAPRLAAQAAERAIADWGGDRSKITHVVSISCTGIIVPGLDFEVIKRCGLGNNTQRFTVLMMGCFGGVTGVKLAKSIASEDPNNCVLVVCCELCSLHLQLDDRSDNIIGACLFGDGASSIIVGGSNIPTGPDDYIYEIIGYDSAIVPETEEALIWDLGSTGWQLGLSPEIPKIIHAHVRDFSSNMIRPHMPKEFQEKIPLDRLDWCLHPGGVAIIHAIEETCGLDAKVNSKATWDVLGSKGNMSSSTVLFVLDQLRTIGVTSDFTVMLAFGPGLNMEGAILRNGRKIPKRQQ